jgi:REP element-mobilizing transposase RayT
MRNSIRVRGFDYAQAGAYFVTVRTHLRMCLLGEVVDRVTRPSCMGEIDLQCWQAIGSHFASVDPDKFVVMPNHVHAIITPLGDPTRAYLSDAVGATHASPLRQIDIDRGHHTHPLGRSSAPSRRPMQIASTQSVCRAVRRCGNADSIHTLYGMTRIWTGSAEPSRRTVQSGQTTRIAQGYPVAGSACNPPSREAPVRRERLRAHPTLR